MTDMPAIPRGAVGLRLVRVLHTRNEFRSFQSVFFKSGRDGIGMTLRRLSAFGMFTDSDSTKDSECLVDFMSEDETTLGEFFVTPKGFTYLRRMWRVTVESDEAILQAAYQELVSAREGTGRHTETSDAD